MRTHIRFCLVALILFLGIIFLYPKNVSAAGQIVPEVKIFENGVQTKSFYGFDLGFRGGVRVATGDVDGNGADEIIVAAGVNGGPNIQIFKNNGEKMISFMAYDIKFRNGVKVTSCDVNNDGRDEIITSPGLRGGPNVKIFNVGGEQLRSFMAYDINFRGGVNIGCGDVNADGLAEIITGAGPGGGPHVRVFNQKGESLNMDFFPFSFNNKGGVNIAVGNVTGDERPEIIVSVAQFGVPVIEVYDDQWHKLSGFYAYDVEFQGGVNIATGNIDNDNYDEIIAAANTGAGPHVRTLDYLGNNQELNFFPYPVDFRGGVFVASGDVIGDGKDEIITGPGFLADTRYSQYPKYIDIDISEQKLKVIENGQEIGDYQISSGKPGMDTPGGIFTVLSKSPTAYSKKYALYMPYWMQFSGQGHGLHGLPYWRLRGGGVIKEGENHLGIRVSHGCVRLSWEDAEIVYNWVSIGTPIIIHN
ncbi:MAG: L,D-transpeptidase family protein [Patescibacteria group bacterium]